MMTRVKALFLIGTIRAALAVASFHRVRRFFCRLVPPRKPDRPRSSEAIIRATQWASELLPGINCLTTSFVGHLMLAANGYDAKLNVGAKICPDSRELEAHAWVSLDGEVVLGNTANLHTFYTLLPAKD